METSSEIRRTPALCHYNGYSGLFSIIDLKFDWNDFLVVGILKAGVIPDLSKLGPKFL